MATSSRRERSSAANFWIAAVFIGSFTLLGSSRAQAAGEPAEDFLKRLRAAKYYDTAILYLDRLDKYPGVDPKLTEAIPLEKAQTLIEAAVDTRSNKDREKFFADATTSLTAFLKNEAHPRSAEARAQLGKLQMVRATQLLVGEPDDQQKKQARESYLAAAKTFDEIIADLREKLEGLKGANAKKDPSLRERYQFEFLQAKVNAGDTRKLAAKTFDNPAKEGKAILEEAQKQFEELADKYSGYVPGRRSFHASWSNSRIARTKQESARTLLGDVGP